MPKLILYYTMFHAWREKKFIIYHQRDVKDDIFALFFFVCIQCYNIDEYWAPLYYSHAQPAGFYGAHNQHCHSATRHCKIIAIDTSKHTRKCTLASLSRTEAQRVNLQEIASDVYLISFDDGFDVDFSATHSAFWSLERQCKNEIMALGYNSGHLYCKHAV